MSRPTRVAAAAGATALLLGLGVSTLTGAASAADTAACSTGALPTSVQGNPNVKAGQAGAVYLFHDSSGFHVRVTHANNSKTNVTVRLDATSFSGIKPVGLERSDTLTMSGDGKVLILRFANYGKIDGVDFSADCSKTLRVDALFNGHRATTRQVKLGAHRVSPTSVPFTIQRTAK